MQRRSPVGPAQRVRLGPARARSPRPAGLAADAGPWWVRGGSDDGGHDVADRVWCGLAFKVWARPGQLPDSRQRSCAVSSHQGRRTCLSGPRSAERRRLGCARPRTDSLLLLPWPGRTGPRHAGLRPAALGAARPVTVDQYVRLGRARERAGLCLSAVTANGTGPAGLRLRGSAGNPPTPRR